MIRSIATTMVLSLLLALGVGLPDAVQAGETVVGNGPLTSQSRSVGDFQSISIGDGIGLKLRQAESTQVTVHGDARVLPWVELAAGADKTLRVRWKRDASLRTRSPSPVWVEVAAPAIRSVAAEGSSAVDIDSLKVPHFALSLSGSGDARARGLQHDELTVARVRISISGSGDVDAAQLAARDVTINIAGSGDAAVQASHALNVSVAGSGHVVYSGSPSVNQAVAGSGSVRRR